jgi:hypothetical protein
MNSRFTFDQIFRANFLDEFTGQTEQTLVTYLITLAAAFVLGLLLYGVYGLTYRGVAYQKSFHDSLIFICMISAMIIATISSNIVLSLGMVGALSIIRFRTPIKDPMDMMYLFLCIGVGIATGAGQIGIAATSTMSIGLLLFLFSKRPGKSSYLLIIRYLGERPDAMKTVLAPYTTSLKSSAVSNGMTELTLEIRGRKIPEELAGAVSAIENVQSAVLMRFTGE